MAYRNQNYMTNRKIKELVDQNQKDYVAPEETPETPITPENNEGPSGQTTPVEIDEEEGTWDNEPIDGDSDIVDDDI